MQLRSAVPGTIPALSVVHPVLPSASIRENSNIKPRPAKAGCATPSPVAYRQDAILLSTGTLPVLPEIERKTPGPVPDTKRKPVAPSTLVRPRAASGSRRISKSNPFVEQDIPLYLVPHIIARAIWQRGEETFRISVVRTKQHYYTIRLRTARPGTRTRRCCTSGAGKTKQDSPGKSRIRQPSPKPAEL